MKVKELIERLKDYEDFNIEFDVNCVNLNLEEPHKYVPYIEVLSDIVIDDICYSEKEICLGYKDKAYFHRVSKMD